MTTLDPAQTWRHGTPAEMIDAIGGLSANRDRLSMWAIECERLYRERGGKNFSDWCWWINHVGFVTDYPGRNINDSVAAEMWADGTAASILHCLFADPFNRVECPRCKGRKRVKDFGSHGYEWTWEDCPACKHTFGVNTGIPSGTIPAPLIEECWKTSTVVDLAREIVGGQLAPGTIGAIGGRYQPDYSRSPMLADALMDAGADNLFVLDHLRSEVHAGECEVLKALTS